MARSGTKCRTEPLSPKSPPIESSQKAEFIHGICEGSCVGLAATAVETDIRGSWYGITVSRFYRPPRRRAIRFSPTGIYVSSLGFGSRLGLQDQADIVRQGIVQQGLLQHHPHPRG